MGGCIIWAPSQSMVATWEDRTLTLADRSADTDCWRGPYSLCRSSAVLRGTYGTGNRLGWVCTGSVLKMEKKGIGHLIITWEPGGPEADPDLLPLDDFKEEAVELYPKVERHRNLTGAPFPSANPNDSITPETIGLCYQVVRGSSAFARSDAMQAITDMPSRPAPPPAGSSWAWQAFWARGLADWLQKGHETYYLAGKKYTYMRHFFTLPETTLGGVIQAPLWGPFAGDTTLSWLRLADVIEPIGVNGSAYRLTSTWLGGPGGHWDPTIYDTLSGAPS